MHRRRNEVVFVDNQLRHNRSREDSGANWVLIVGGAVLTAVSVRLWGNLKGIINGKQSVNVKPATTLKKRINYSLDPEFHCCIENVECCYHCQQGNAESKLASYSPLSKDSDRSLQLVTIPMAEISKDSPAIAWISSPEQLKPHHPSSSSGSPSASESGSDIFSKCEVIQKLRQQLRRRDEMIMDMQAQISELQNSLTAQMTQSSNLQSQHATVHDLLMESAFEIQHLRKIICNHCLARPNPNDRSNGYIGGTNDREMHCVSLEDSSSRKLIDMLRMEIGNLKEVIQGKEFLIQNYKEQKLELSSKINDLQRELSSGTLTML